jgi:hypothetical protein
VQVFDAKIFKRRRTIAITSDKINVTVRHFRFNPFQYE